ncbi:hypothetical protein [Bradyrhizobium guangzhouense]|uniref:hypothetical protein n=1 Tax=Bradyrhizobium guangzhouense TaxID=1325095 RepID=UPI001009F240|nr:hypothetical protein [Bradyrhizobium guangzhouense]
MWIRAFLLGLSLTVCAALPADARSGGVGHDDPLNSEHIDVLPAEVRHYIAGICKGPARAQHDFATYLPSEKRWRINLEYLRCEGLGAFRRGNQCLDVDFVGDGSHFHLARKGYADCGF